MKYAKVYFEDVEVGSEMPPLVKGPIEQIQLTRYAGASGDFNPIHIDLQFAQEVGLPSNILHGLYSMAQVARACTSAAGGDPRSLRRLSVQFRGMGFPEQEMTVTGTAKESGSERTVVQVVAEQGGNQIIRNAEAELEAR